MTPLKITKSTLESLAVATGTVNQRERFDAGVLPEDELLSLARVQLFKEFAFPRWNTRIDHEKLEREFRRGPTCGHIEGHRLDYTTVHEPKLDANEWAMFKQLTTAASRTQQHSWLDGNAVKVDLAARKLECSGCSRTLSRAIVKVSIEWAGRTLVREYALDVGKYLELGGQLTT